MVESKNPKSGGVNHTTFLQNYILNRRTFACSNSTMQTIFINKIYHITRLKMQVTELLMQRVSATPNAHFSIFQIL